MTRLKSLFAFLLISFVFLSAASAEILIDETYDFSMDIPEGYELKENSPDSNSYCFEHPNIPVTFVLKVVTDTKMYSTYSALSDSLNKLNAQREMDSTVWNDTSCSIANIEFTLDQKYSGWAVSAPLAKDNTFVVLLCYSPSSQYEKCVNFILATLNSLCVSADYYNTPGIITTYAYPKLGNHKYTVDIGNKNISFLLDDADIEASEFVINMEYAVLILYAKHNLWQEAWQRYYRMIYRDCFGRLENFSDKVINTLFEEGRLQNPDNPELYFAQQLLTWTQGFEYERLKNRSTDLTSPVAAVVGDGNDCDCRSLLICILARASGIESILLISNEYSHAMPAIEINALGQKYIPAGTDREFIMGETTAPVTWGLISADMQDREKWIPVYLP